MMQQQHQLSYPFLQPLQQPHAFVCRKNTTDSRCKIRVLPETPLDNEPRIVAAETIKAFKKQERLVNPKIVLQQVKALYPSGDTQFVKDLLLRGKSYRWITSVLQVKREIEKAQKRERQSNQQPFYSEWDATYDLERPSSKEKDPILGFIIHVPIRLTSYLPPPAVLQILRVFPEANPRRVTRLLEQQSLEWVVATLVEELDDNDKPKQRYLSRHDDANMNSHITNLANLRTKQVQPPVDQEVVEIIHNIFPSVNAQRLLELWGEGHTFQSIVTELGREEVVVCC